MLSCAQNKAEAELRKVLKKEDAAAALRLVLHDAATFDIATRTGGMNGSIVTRWNATALSSLPALHKLNLLWLGIQPTERHWDRLSGTGWDCLLKAV